MATAVGGVPDAVTDGVSGLLVPPEDPAALAGAVLADARRPRRGAARRAEAGRTAVRAFSAGRMLEEQHALYQRLLARRGIVLAERPA